MSDLFDAKIFSFHGIGITSLSNFANFSSLHIVLYPAMRPLTADDMKPDTHGIVAGDPWVIFPALQPRSEMSLPLVGRNDDIPHNAAGHLSDPPMSLPTPKIDPPPPINEPSPPDEPPTSRVGSYGLPQ